MSEATTSLIVRVVRGAGSSLGARCSAQQLAVATALSQNKFCMWGRENERFWKGNNTSRHEGLKRGLVGTNDT